MKWKWNKMNERIRELASQIDWSTDTSYGELTKFAELIVRECANYAEYQLQIGGTNADKIKQHFGVLK